MALKVLNYLLIKEFLGFCMLATSTLLQPSTSSIQLRCKQLASWEVLAWATFSNQLHFTVRFLDVAPIWLESCVHDSCALP